MVDFSALILISKNIVLKMAYLACLLRFLGAFKVCTQGLTLPQSWPRVVESNFECEAQTLGTCGSHGLMSVLHQLVGAGCRIRPRSNCTSRVVT